MPSSHHLKMCYWRTSFRPQDPGNPGGAEITTLFDQFFVLKCHGGYGTGASLRAPLDKESSERRFNRSSNCVCLKMGCSYNPLVSQNPLTIGEEEGLIAILIGLGSLIKRVFFPFSSGRERERYIYIYMYVCMYVYIYMCVCIYIYMFIPFSDIPKSLGSFQCPKHQGTFNDEKRWGDKAKRQCIFTKNQTRPIRPCR